LKKIVFLVLGAACIAGSFAWWHANRVAAGNGGPYAQVFIHGTPVCVFTLGGNILAQVGQCPESSDMENGDPAGNAPFHGEPGMELPPGHPPVDRDLFPDDRRLIPI
jgi:hypothetical protein